MYNYQNPVCNKTVHLLVMHGCKCELHMKPARLSVVLTGFTYKLIRLRCIINILIIQGSLYMASIVAAYFFCTT